jgi:hypothetical protein
MIEKQKPYDVFISYATEDEAYAEKVANSLPFFSHIALSR